jgi:hypothetical protein
VAAGPRPQAAQLPSMALELLGVDMASGHHRRRTHPVKVADALGCKHMCPDQKDERHQRRRCCAYPVGQRRDIEINALPGIDRTLAVE